MSYDEPIYLKDLVPCSPLKPAEITNEERRKFLAEVEEEVERRWPGMDERLRRSEIKTVYWYASMYGIYGRRY